VYLGEDFTSAEKLSTEDNLFKFHLGDASPPSKSMRKSFSLDYTRFQIEALHEKYNPGSFMFQILKQRKKTSSQY